jgi:hypothetical protein
VKFSKTKKRENLVRFTLDKKIQKVPKNLAKTIRKNRLKKKITSPKDLGFLSKSFVKFSKTKKGKLVKFTLEFFFQKVPKILAKKIRKIRLKKKISSP